MGKKKSAPVDPRSVPVPEVTHCVFCGKRLSPRTVSENRAACDECSSPSGEMAEIWRNLRLKERYAGTRTTVSDYFESLPTWQAIQHFSCAKFSHTTFTTDTWKRLRDWLSTERGINEEAFLRMRPEAVEKVLRDDATSQPADPQGNDKPGEMSPMPKTFESAMACSERWPLTLEALKCFATSNDASHFVSVLESLNEQLDEHGSAIVAGSDSLTEVATQIGTNVHLGNREYHSASAAALALSNTFVMDIWKAIDLLAVSRAVGGDKTAHFDPETAGSPAHWPDCREAVAKFFDGGWWQDATLRNLGIAVGRERVALFPSQPAARQSGPSSTDANPMTEPVAPVEFIQGILAETKSQREEKEQQAVIRQLESDRQQAAWKAFTAAFDATHRFAIEATGADQVDWLSWAKLWRDTAEHLTDDMKRRLRDVPLATLPRTLAISIRLLLCESTEFDERLAEKLRGLIADPELRGFVGWLPWLRDSLFKPVMETPGYFLELQPADMPNGLTREEFAAVKAAFLGSGGTAADESASTQVISTVSAPSVVTAPPAALASVGKPGDGTNSPIESGERSHPQLKEPSKVAFAAYRIHKLLGKKQEETARLVKEEFKCITSQGQVSRWCDAVADWIAAGGLLPPSEVTMKPTVRSVDPDDLDMGKRVDGLTPRQRERRNDS